MPNLQILCISVTFRFKSTCACMRLQCFYVGVLVCRCVHLGLSTPLCDFISVEYDNHAVFCFAALQTLRWEHLQADAMEQGLSLFTMVDQKALRTTFGLPRLGSHAFCSRISKANFCFCRLSLLNLGLISVSEFVFPPATPYFWQLVFGSSNCSGLSQR